MKSNTITFTRVLAIAFIFGCTAVGWFILGGALTHRSFDRDAALGGAVAGSWGPPMQQPHPTAWYVSPTGKRGRSTVRPAASNIRVRLAYEPKRKGLLWYRTYLASFEAEYQIPNPTPIAQTIYVAFELPSDKTSYSDFSFALGDAAGNDQAPQDGRITQAVVVPANGSVPLKVAYRARGLNRWDYLPGQTDRVRNFRLNMETDFAEIDFPAGTGSPTTREQAPDGGWQLVWDYPDVIGAQSIAMDMPKALNAGPVAARISFFAPVSLLFFFAVLLILGAVQGVNLHPMNYFFLAAGCFGFQLLFAYLVDLLPLHASFAIAAAVSLVLVSGYVHAVGGKALSRISLPAQLGYMVLFSYSFFFDGVSGLTITIGAIVTLAILMIATAKVDWSEKFARKPKVQPGILPPPIPHR